MFAPPCSTHLVGAESILKVRRVDGQAANGQVLAARGRAQNSSVGTADRQQVQWHLQNQAVCGAAAPLVPPRWAHGAHGCPRSAWSALRAASEDGAGGPLTKVIEYDVPPTRPGRVNARGARGGLYTNAFAKSEQSCHSHRCNKPIWLVISTPHNTCETSGNGDS